MDLDDIMSDCDGIAEQQVQVATTHVDSIDKDVSYFTSHTGDAHLDSLLNETHRELAEYRAIKDELRQQIGEGKYLSIDDAIQRGGSQGLHDFTRQMVDGLGEMSPDEVRQWAHNRTIEHDVEMSRLHESEVIHDYGEWQQQRIKGQNDEQFQAEKEGYRQVFPQGEYSYGLPTGDPNIFEKNGEYYRLIPGTGGTMERLTGYPH